MELINTNQVNYFSLSNSIKNGKTICYPTETLYGLGCAIDNDQAIAKLYEIKSREKEKKFSILFKDIKMLETYCEFNDTEKDLILHFMPGPLSMLLTIRDKNLIKDSLIGSNNKINCRVSSHPFIINLFQHLDVPIISTSANISGEKNMFTFKKIYNTFHDLVDIIIDDGNIKSSSGSTIIELNGKEIKIIREGDIKEKDIMVFLHGRN
ncbi:MAG: L-threonylcarbamoyladenylate synthase [Thermodesulfobacteriota bacterium]|nr:L-threonylcarbamoyladenylate synthase [Thermodesulfobacteriota bacterium]